MSYTSSLLEFIHTFSTQSDLAESCAILQLHDRDFQQPIESKNFPPSLYALIICKSIYC